MNDVISVEELADEAEAFLDANASLRTEVHFVWGKGSDRRQPLPREHARAGSDRARLGQGLGPEGVRRRVRLDQRPHRLRRARPAGATTSASGAELEARYEIPSLSIYGIGLGMVAPTILAHATEEVKDALPPLPCTAVTSSPASCSASPAPAPTSPRCRPGRSATATSGSSTARRCGRRAPSLADIGEIICRTDPDLPKHRGLTGFVVDMHAPGVEVRPLRQMTGGASFNEVFFTDVRIPDSHRLGEVNGGWTVALTTLMNERAAIGGGGGGVGLGGHQPNLGARPPTGTLRRPPGPPAARPDHHQRTRVAATRTCGPWPRSPQASSPGPEMSIGKLSLTQNLVRTCDLVSSVLGPALIADTGAWGTYSWSELVLGIPGMRIAGGTDEVLRNIVGERVLGLPKEPSAG